MGSHGLHRGDGEELSSSTSEFVNEIQFMQLWQSKFGLLLPEYREEFLSSETTRAIVKFPRYQIKSALKVGDASLSGILQTLQSGIHIQPTTKNPTKVPKASRTKPKLKNSIKRVNPAPQIKEVEPTGFIPSDYYLVEPGAYKLGFTIYSVRRDRKTKILQAWLFDSAKGAYRRPFYSKEEHEILSKLTSKHRLTLRMAEKYSLETGMCCHCGRLLTAQKSVNRGMGPVCKTLYN